jgi:hypothetical protein
MKVVAQLYVGKLGTQLCPLTHGAGDWLKTLPAGTYDLVLALHAKQEGQPAPDVAEASGSNEQD